MDLTFKVTGRGRIGADGLAFWYTAAKVNECVDFLDFDFFSPRAQRARPLVMYTGRLTDGLDLVSFLTALTMTTNTTIPTSWP